MSSLKRQKRTPFLEMLSSLPQLPHGGLASGEALEVHPSEESLRVAQAMVGGLLARSEDGRQRVNQLAAKLDLLRQLDSAQVAAAAEVHPAPAKRSSTRRAPGNGVAR
jgi:hypothetical protein